MKLLRTTRNNNPEDLKNYIIDKIKNIVSECDKQKKLTEESSLHDQTFGGQLVLIAWCHKHSNHIVPQPKDVCLTANNQTVTHQFTRSQYRQPSG